MEIGTDVSTTRRVVSAKAARQMTLMMERVVDIDDGVKAPLANVPGYRVAADRYRPASRHLRHRRGKAQLLRRCTNTLSPSRAWHRPNPRFTVYVVIQAPKVEGAGGGLTAGPVFSKADGLRAPAVRPPRATARRRSCPSSG